MSDTQVAQVLGLALAAWRLCLREKYLFAGIVGAASYTRINGVFLAAALMVMCVMHQRRSGKPVRVGPLASLAVASLRAIAYAGWLTIVTGRPMAWLDVQREAGDRSLDCPGFRSSGRL